MRVVLSATALARLAEIEDFIGRDDPRAAVRIVDRLLDRMAALARLPRRGRRLPELPRAALLEVVEGPFRIVYRVRRGAVEVVTVFHGRRQLPRGDLG